MILGLPFSTFFWVVIVWLLAVVAGIVYGAAYKESDEWLTIEDVLAKRKTKKKNER